MFFLSYADIKRFCNLHESNFDIRFGLYNVSAALLKIQGTIEIESELLKGTEFFVNIPSK